MPEVVESQPVKSMSLGPQLPDGLAVDALVEVVLLHGMTVDGRKQQPLRALRVSDGLQHRTVCARDDGWIMAPAGARVLELGTELVAQRIVNADRPALVRLGRSGDQLAAHVLDGVADDQRAVQRVYVAAAQRPDFAGPEAHDASNQRR